MDYLKFPDDHVHSLKNLDVTVNVDIFENEVHVYLVPVSEKVVFFKEQ